MIKERINIFIKYLPLVKQLVDRDLKKKYRRSFLGYLWSLLNPLMMMIITTAVFSALFKYNIDNFPLYLISGQIVFNYFSEATSNSLTSIIQNGELIKKIYVPKYIFPLSSVVFSTVNFLFSLVAVVLVIIFTRAELHLSFLLLPVLIAYVFIFCLGIALILCSISVKFRDVIYIYGVFIMALSYLTPIFYPISILPDTVLNILFFNPLYYFLKFSRNIFLDGIFPRMELHLICLLFGICSLVLGLAIFKRKQDSFILYL